MRSLWLLCRPWQWRRGRATEELRRELSIRFGTDVSLFSCGCEGLHALLKSLDTERGDEIILQAYTCVVLPNAIEAAGLVPIYSDVDQDTLNLDCADVERKITHRTKAIISQNTFGIPAETRKLRALCDRYNLFLIEDCAHIIPDQTGPQDIGMQGDFVLLSFGRDKAISGISGGAMLSRHSGISQKLLAEEGGAQALSAFHIARLLLYPLLYWIARPLYGIGIGKVLLWIARKLHLLIPIVTNEEKRGTMHAALHRIPNACASLALMELRKLQMINDHRRLLTNFYIEALHRESLPIPAGIRENLPLQKFPIFVQNADGIRSSLRRNNIHLNDGWTGCVVCPADIDLLRTGYIPGSDPQAEAACAMILSLPTHPTMTIDLARKLMKELSSILRKI